MLTIPPFPATDPAAGPGDDAPVFFHRPPRNEDLRHYHYVDMRREDGQLFVRRHSGHAMIVTGTGVTVQAAQDAARARARNVIAPELRWRADIGDRFSNGDAARLQELGWLAAGVTPQPGRTIGCPKTEPGGNP